MGLPERSSVDPDASASARLRYGICDCEYPCSCCELDGVRYGSWKEALDARDAGVKRLREAIEQAGLDLPMIPDNNATYECLREALGDIVHSAHDSDHRGRAEAEVERLRALLRQSGYPAEVERLRKALREALAEIKRGAIDTAMGIVERGLNG